MASYRPKLLEKKYNNWVKAQLAVLFTKEGIEPFVCNEIKQFQLQCLDDICYQNGLLSGTLCSNCRTENVIKCPTKRICNVGPGKCSYHRNAATRYNPAGCPYKICNNFTTEIQNVHRYSGPSYKNTDATKWCSNSWEVAKCFMPPDGYKNKASAAETDFNGIISIILNYKDFQGKIHENLNNKRNMFEEAREIGREVRHSSTLEVEDIDLQKYFKLLQKLLSDRVYLATDTHAQNAKKKLTELENDTLVIGKDDIRKVLDDVAKAIQDKMKAGLEEKYDRIKLDMIERKQEDLLYLQSEISDGVTQLKYEAGASVKRLHEECDKEVRKIREQGDKERADLAGLGESSHKKMKTASKDGKEKEYIDSKQNLKDELIAWYTTNQSTVPLSPLTDDFHTPLAGFYIMPEMDIQTYLPGGRKETTRVKSLKDLFTPRKEVSREIYLSAAAGFGKTSFSKYFAITWCQAHKNDENYSNFKDKELEALSCFEFLFLVQLRDSTKVCDVDDMIEQQVIQYLACSSSMPKGILKDILREENCLVILDGLDEWTHPENDCTRLPKSIPHRYAREKCVILTTTRPWKLGMSNLKTNQIDKTVELVKIDKQNVRQFSLNAMKILKGNIEEEKLIYEVCRFEEEIRHHDLDEMESTPLLLLYLICLWTAKIPIGKSAVELYTGIIELLLSRTEKLHGMFHSWCKTSPSNIPVCFRMHQHFCSYYTFLMTIGKLAFYTLFSKKKEHTLVFDKNVAEKYLNQEDLKSSCLSGILSESKVKTLINESSKISFSHKTVQEYFSALFISFQNTNDVQKIIFEECNCLQNILDMSKVFVFISNMNPELMSAISTDLMPVINNDDKTSKYRTLTYYDYMHIKPLQDIQDMYISCVKEGKENKELKLCLQDLIIDEKCQQENYFKQLQHLCQQNKENIKSIMIRNEGICSLQKIVNLFTLSDLPQIEKLFYYGEIVKKEMMSLLLNPLKCLTVLSSKWENHQFVENSCRLSAVINRRLVQLHHLEVLNIHCFTMTHKVMKTLLNFLTSKKTMKEIRLYGLYCSDHKNTSCRGFNIDLSQHSKLRCLGFGEIPVSQLNMDVSLLEECDVGNLYKPGVVSSYLSQLTAANKLQSFECSYLESSSDIDTMLQTLPFLYHIKDVRLQRMNLGERSLTLTPKMNNIEFVNLCYITMFCSALYGLITVINKLPHTVTVYVRGCDIKTEAEFKEFKTFIKKKSDNFVVIRDGNLKSGVYVFEFKTTTTKY
ncbi:uncharacterized protein LOC132718574 [Ruditapes philippinarum]|uniref:uncharacterized protein LOC132718574 n=1 Tax=Ruditapes philippinarum TaxID=129788 RepID=UPI00295B620D|nr:uncharacterized protein LOC132718574 [Ruditapes philippinarum]XP_060558274.1 uncharacterized protein LOC132718574 [Ruditapes philippinarum]